MKSLGLVDLLRVLLFLGCSLFLMSGTAQKKINKNYAFTDGVYSSHQEFKNNSPAFPLYRIPDFDYKLDGENNLLFLAEESIARLPESVIKSMDNIWGICVKGKPYLKINPQDKNGVIYFVRYYIIGRVCYFYYPSIVDKKVEMSVYSPYTGNKVAQKTVTNRARKLIKKIMLYNTGEIKACNSKNFKIWAKDDLRLMKTLNDMSEKEIESKLFKTIKIYNDRHPIYENS
ncbi:hypothetical protein OAK19_00540 [Aureispira]|nr:hypothetical protein [Aureispira sp.]